MIRDSRAEESALKVVRDDMVKAGLTRSTVNARKEGAGPVGGGSPRLRHQPPGRVGSFGWTLSRRLGIGSGFLDTGTSIKLNGSTETGLWRPLAAQSGSAQVIGISQVTTGRPSRTLFGTDLVTKRVLIGGSSRRGNHP